MSRLQRHQRKQAIFTFAFLAFVLLLVLYLLFTFGIRLLLSASAFIAGLTTKTSSSQITKNNEILGNIDVDTIPSATNSAQIIVGGSVLNFSLLDFYINGLKVKEVNLSSSDTFSEQIGDLTEGNNQVYVLAKMQDGKGQKQSQTFDVLYKSTKPKLEIKDPKDKSTIAKSDITVSGSTDKETFIKINDLPVVVDAQGNFQTSLRLKNGDNTITIVATDIAGNTNSQTLTVSYQPND